MMYRSFSLIREYIMGHVDTDMVHGRSDQLILLCLHNYFWSLAR